MTLLLTMILVGNINAASGSDTSSRKLITKCFGERGILYQGEAENILHYSISNSGNQSFYAFEDAKTKRQHIIFGSCVQSQQTMASDEEDFLAPNN